MLVDADRMAIGWTLMLIVAARASRNGNIVVVVDGIVVVVVVVVILGGGGGCAVNESAFGCWRRRLIGQNDGVWPRRGEWRVWIDGGHQDTVTRLELDHLA